MQGAVFKRQLVQSHVTQFDLKDDMLDKRCNDQHPMPQCPVSAHRVINQPFKSLQTFFSPLLYILPNGVQMLLTARAAESSVLLTKHPVQAGLQELHSAHKESALIQG